MTRGSVREIRALDRRPGEPGYEVRIVAGVAIEKGVPLPKGPGCGPQWLEALLALEVGESFVSMSKSCIWSKRAKQTNRLFACQTLSDEDATKLRGKYRIWRVQ